MAAGESPCEIPSSVPGVLACGLHRIDPSWCDRPMPGAKRCVATCNRCCSGMEPDDGAATAEALAPIPTDLRSSHCSASSASLPSPRLPPLLSSRSQAPLPRLIAGDPAPSSRRRSPPASPPSPLRLSEQWARTSGGGAGRRGGKQVGTKRWQSHSMIKDRQKAK